MRLFYRKYWLGLLLLAFSAIASAQALTPERYIDIELQIRQLTNDGMQQRLFLLRLQNEDSVQDQSDLDGETLTLINAVFHEYGVTAGTHTAYGTQNAETIADYLDDNPAKMQQLNIIQSEFQLHSSHITSALTGQ